MKSLYKTFGVVVSAALAAVTASCGDNGVNCGEGTKAVDGSCVPDGTVVCTGGTRFNAEKGTCEVDPTACQDGTVLVNGKCQDPAVVAADATEAAEPNDSNPQNPAGTIVVPAIGAKGFVAKGCITPYKDAAGSDTQGPDGIKDPDRDLWLVEVAAPTLLDVQVDGVRGLVAGFETLSADQDLVAAGFQRDAVSVTSDLAGRELYLPRAGLYAFRIQDSRTMLKTDIGPGNANTCYYATITQKALPVGTPLAAATLTASYKGKVGAFDYTPKEGEIVFADIIPNKVYPGSLNALASVVTLKNGNFVRMGSYTPEQPGLFGPTPADPVASSFVAGLKATDKVTFIYDPALVYTGDALEYQVDPLSPSSQALPLTGSTINIAGAAALNGIGDLRFGYFDVANAGDVVHIDLSGTTAFDFIVIDSDLVKRASGNDGGLDGGNEISADAEWYRFKSAGRYYVAFYATAASTITSKVFVTTVNTATVGTLVDNAPLGDVTRNSAFLKMSTNEKWISANASATNFGAGASVGVSLYANDSEGRFDSDFFSLADHAFNVAGNSPLGGRITFPTFNTLVRVVSTATPAANAQFDLDLKPRVFTDLATVVDGTPVTRNGDSFVANDAKRYFVQVKKGSLVTVVATPVSGVNATVRSLDVDEGTLASSNVNGAGQAETVVIKATEAWVAFEVSNAATAGVINLTVSAQSPPAYADACNGGMELAQFADSTTAGLVGDEALTAAQTLPVGFNFTMFGTAVTTFKVSSNGWLSFDPALLNRALFASKDFTSAAAPKASIAAFWDDLADVKICRKDTATTVTLQWVGDNYNTQDHAETQVVLYKNSSRVDFVYGPMHVDTGLTASAGARNLAGNSGLSLFFNTASVVANTGLVFPL